MNPIDHRLLMMMAVVAENTVDETDTKIVVDIAEVTVVADTAAVAIAAAEEPDQTHRNRQTKSASQAEAAQKRRGTRYPDYSSCSPLHSPRGS